MNLDHKNHEQEQQINMNPKQDLDLNRWPKVELEDAKLRQQTVDNKDNQGKYPSKELPRRHRH